MDKKKKKIILISIGVFVLMAILAASGAVWHERSQTEKTKRKSKPRIEKRSVPRNESTTSTETRPDRRQPDIWISKEGDYFRQSGLISLAATDEPVIFLEGINFNDEATVELYQSSMDNLLSYLMYKDEENERGGTESVQINPQIDFANLNKIASEKYSIKSNNGDDLTRVMLPLEERGVWALKVMTGSIEKSVFIVRSDLGAVVKESGQELILWAQKFSDKRSASGVGVEVYNLKDRKRIISSGYSGNNGITRLQLSSLADLAVVKKGNDQALIPLNLKNLNIGYNRTRFSPQSARTKYFSFLDRPVYQPGDTANFKVFMRRDSDGVYSMSQGWATAEVSTGYGEEREVIFTKDYLVSANGTIDGSFNLPKDLTTGDYRLNVKKRGAEVSSDYWGFGEAGSISSFKVQYYQKPEYSINVSSDKKEVVAGDNFSLEFFGNYFSGQPVVGVEVEYEIHSRNFYEPAYYDDNYNDHYQYSYYRWGDSKEEGQVTLGQDGKAKIDLQANLYSKRNEDIGKAKLLTVTAKLKDESGNPVSSSVNVLVRAGEYGIYKQEGNQTWDRKVNEDIPFRVLLVGSSGVSVGDNNITAQIKRVWWEKVKEDKKKYPKREKREEEIEPKQIKTDQDGKAEFLFNFENPGNYEVLLKSVDKRGNLIQKEFNFWITDKDGRSYGEGQSDNLAMRVNQEEYDPGQVATIEVFSEIPNRDVLLTTGREEISRAWVVHIEEKSKKVEVSLTDSDMPNIAIWANSFNDKKLENVKDEIIISTDKKKMNVELIPDKEQYYPGQTATVKVKTTDFQNRPVSAEVAVWLADKSLFELADDETGDIFNHFWRKRYSSIENATSLDGIHIDAAEKGGCFLAGTGVLMADGTTRNIEDVRNTDKILTRASKESSQLVPAKVTEIHKTKVEGFLTINNDLKLTPNHVLWVNDTWKEAGDIKIGDTLVNQNNQKVKVQDLEWRKEEVGVYNLEVEEKHSFFAQGVWVHNGKGGGGERSNFQDVAYWNPAVKTNANGEALISFKLPDNLTTWVIAGVGATFDTKVGQGLKEFKVSKDVIVRPILPNVLRKGDKIILSSLVQNYTPDELTFDVGLSFDSGKVVEADKVVKVGSDSSELISWEVWPEQIKEDAKVTFSVISQSDQSKSDIITKKVPVWEFGFWQKQVQVGSGSKVFEFDYSFGTDPTKRKAELILTPTLLGTLPEAMDYLVGYPYGCVEQTTSKFAPTLIAKENPDLFKDTVEDKDLEKMALKGVERLRELQNSDGTWGWWRSGDKYTFLSAYVVESLVKAKQLGIEVDPEILEKTQNYFENENNFSKAKKEEQIARAYILSTLESSKSPEIITDLNEEVSSDFLALAVMHNIKKGHRDPNENGLNLLLNQAKSAGESLYWESGEEKRIGSKDSVTALALRAILASGEKYDSAVKAARYLSQNRRTGRWANTFATAQAAQALVEFTKVKQELNPNYQYQVVLNGNTLAQGSLTSSSQREVIEIPIDQIDQQKIEITKEGEGELYSTLAVNEFFIDKELKEENNGLKISRSYKNAKSGECSLKAGDIAEVTLEVESDGDPKVGRYLVIEDHLSSGMIPINPNLKNEKQEYGGSSYRRNYMSSWEISQNGIVIPIENFSKNNKVTYKARVVNEGEFYVPPATTEFMYMPEISARSAVSKVSIPGEVECQEEEKKDLETLSDLVGATESSLEPESKKKDKEIRRWWVTYYYQVLSMWAIVAGIGVILWRKKK